MKRGALEWTAKELRSATAVIQRGGWKIARSSSREWGMGADEFLGNPMEQVSILREFGAEQELLGQVVYCALPRSEVVVLKLTENISDIRKIAQEQLPWVLEEAAWGSAVAHLPNGQEAVLIVGASKKRITQYVEAISAAGMVVGGVQLSRVSLEDALSHPVGISTAVRSDSTCIEALALAGPDALGPWILSPQDSPAARQGRHLDQVKLSLAGASVLFVLMGLGASMFDGSSKEAQKSTAARLTNVRIAPVLHTLFQAIPPGSKLIELQYDAERRTVQLRGHSVDHSQASQLLAGLEKTPVVQTVRSEKTSWNASSNGVEFSGEAVLR